MSRTKTVIAQWLPKALLQHQIQEKALTHFDACVAQLLENMRLVEERGESEENAKKYITDFFQESFYSKSEYTINTYGRLDLVIQRGGATATPIVLLECKRPQNTTEFPEGDKINTKALQELLLYYLRQRVDEKNNTLKHLVITNGYTWYFFQAKTFYEIFYRDKNGLVKEYEKFRDGKMDSQKTTLFYQEIAAKYIEKALESEHKSLSYLRVDLRTIRNKKKELLHLYKFLSPYGLLGDALGNDNNQLNKEFYYELLHIMGLEEQQEKGKKVIGRKAKGKRNYSSLLELTIYALEENDALQKLTKRKNYGKNKEEQYFHVGLELCLSWINRVLFLKLLEAQLIQQEADRKGFLNYQFLPKFNKLKELFFSVLAKRKTERHERIEAKFSHIPYLNSSLFDETNLERNILSISALEEGNLELYEKTVLKDANLKRMQGDLPLLDYLFRFLEAYNFSEAEEGEALLQEGEQQKSLISASVLGLIFEKINGYQDGSFYTPAYITMYMSRQSLQKAVIQKLSTTFDFGEDIEDLEELNFKLFRQKKKLKSPAEKAHFVQQVNEAIDSLRICDPAVGSGHFLVSALNELLYIKNELGVLLDAADNPLRIELEIENDELIIRDHQGALHEYQPQNKNSQQIQQAIFENKRHLIENCLFGVDLNPNSVKICRLRLWIELLKHAYYTPDGELQTLPNIDINIKTGNSLISRFSLDEDLKNAFKRKGRKKADAPQVQYSVEDYKKAVANYKSSKDKSQKRDIIKIIDTVKASFQDSLDKKFTKRIALARGLYENQHIAITNHESFGNKITKAEKTKLKKLEANLRKAEMEKAAILHNEIYERAFEWRFEFPEVLDDAGNFKGFDVVIGNPPYIRHEAIKWMKPYLKEHFEVFSSLADILTYFTELAYNILSPGGVFQYIISGQFVRATYGTALREFLSGKVELSHFIDFAGANIFNEATVDALILGFHKKERTADSKFLYHKVDKGDEFKKQFAAYLASYAIEYKQKYLSADKWLFETDAERQLAEKLKASGPALADWEISINRGLLTGYNAAFVIEKELRDQLITADPKNEEVIKPLLRGRDIQKFKAEFAEQYLVYIPWHFPLHLDPEIIGASLAAEEKLKAEYSVLYDYLLSHKSGLSKRNKAETGIRYEWYALQRWASNYYKDFKQPKLVWKRIGSILRFSYEEEEIYCLDSTCIATGSHLKYLLAVLNSKLCRHELFRIAPKTGTGDLIISVQALNPIHVPIPTPAQEKVLTQLVEQRLAAETEAEQQRLEAEIDRAVYALYALTEAEIAMVEEDTK